MLSVFTVWLCCGIVTAIGAAGCSARRYDGADHNIVCVCNATYCDEVERIDTIPKGNAVIVVSSLSGLRFNRTTVPFTKKRNTPVPSISVDARSSHQQIIGFGGAFTDAAGINIAALSDGAQDMLMRAYFGSTGLEYTIGRVPIASTDFSTREYSYDDIQGDFNLTKFALAKEDMQFKIPFILRAMNLTAQSLLLFASPWSAPGWMKTTNRMKGPGALRDGVQYHQSYADYFVKFFEAYASKGVPFWGLTIQNEPTSGALPDWAWQTMMFTAKTQTAFVRDHLGPALKANKLTRNLKVMALDDGRMMLPGWADTIFSDPVATNYVDGVAVHWYDNAYIPSFVLTTTHNRHPDKFILATEACTGFTAPHGPILGDWFRAEQYASNIITDLNNFVAGWTDWNLCLDETGGPNWAYNMVDAPIIVNRTADEFYKQPMFYAMGHFSKFVLPGALRITTKVDATNLPFVEATATVQDGRRTLVVLSRSSTPTDVIIDEMVNGETSLQLTLEPHSIYTVVWDKQ